MEYRIRDIQPSEAKQIKKAACTNFSVVEQLFMSKPKLGIVAETSEGSIAGGAFLVMIDVGKQKVGCVDIIFVLPEYRGSGVAKLLYHAAVETLHLHGCETVMALVRGDNSQSLCRFEEAGLYPTSLYQLKKKIGLFSLAMLFIKTAALACATGCWILCEGLENEKVEATGRNIIAVAITNGVMLLGGALIGTLFHTMKNPLGSFFAALLLLTVIVIGETMGRYISGGKWNFIMPEGGLVPSIIIALLGGFYPMMGHWYLRKRENTNEYRKKMAAPAKGAWILLMITTFVGSFFREVYPFFSSLTDLGLMLLLLYMLPFYPFDTFGGRRIREDNKWIYLVLSIFSIITIVLLSV